MIIQYTGSGKDRLFRYTIQLNCKGTGKVAASTVTQYSDTVQLLGILKSKLYKYRYTVQVKWYRYTKPLHRYRFTVKVVKVLC